MLLLPCLLALGIGLSLNNARAVLEAIFNHKSDFTRTPKYGIERKSQSWRSCKYRALKSTLPLAELAFAIYFSYFVWFAVAHRTISVGTVSAHVSGRVLLCLTLLSRALVAQTQFRCRPRACCNSCVTKVEFLSKRTRMFRLFLGLVSLLVVLLLCSPAPTVSRRSLQSRHRQRARSKADAGAKRERTRRSIRYRLPNSDSATR